jgi:glutamate-1-semialdehyde 2,1-aminomutase|tara:strand:- start:3154 stop:4461 length:1308 start_codon:yes stop_codon:yes gene_type:complete
MKKKLNKNFGILNYKKAQKIIAGGTMLFSKKPELFSPNHWPTYFDKAKGCYVWGIDGKKYLDMYFGVGTNVLGYANNYIDNKVISGLKKSNMSSLNALEEFHLAKKLISFHKWAKKVRFTRSGGEANAVAIRIARASTKKQNIAFCGYHGWHDWYLSSNLNNSNNLNEHLMSNLKFEGVTKQLKNTSFPFLYNDFKGLEELVAKKNIGIIKMEVYRNILPKNNFLKKIRNLCNKKKIILIFDECTSGFRENLGGKHLDFNVNPDMAIFGKAIGNGYAINAILGKDKYMKNINKTFISSTFWTERSGLIAALETINQMQRIKSYKAIKVQGQKIKKIWRDASKRTNIDININGMDSIPSFTFERDHNLSKSYLTQEMLKKNILASNSVYVSIVHTDEILKKYKKIFNKIFDNLQNSKNKKKLLDGKESFSLMSRLN